MSIPLHEQYNTDTNQNSIDILQPNIIMKISIKFQIALRLYRVYRCHLQIPITEGRKTGYSRNVTLEQWSNTYFSGYLVN